MKTNTPPPSSGPPLQTVLFEFFDLSATSVTIAGTFNDWQPHATALLKLGAGRWARKLVLPPGIYEYRFVVDGKWMSDPTAAETALNPFGQVNSVVKVPCNSRTFPNHRFRAVRFALAGRHGEFDGPRPEVKVIPLVRDFEPCVLRSRRTLSYRRAGTWFRLG